MHTDKKDRLYVAKIGENGTRLWELTGKMARG